MPLDEDTANLLAELAMAGVNFSPEDLVRSGVIRPGIPSAAGGMPVLPPQRMPRPGDPGLPPGGQTIATSQLSPQVGALMHAGGVDPRYGPGLDLAYQVGEAGPRQMQRAEGAINRAEHDPSVANLAGAVAHTGAAALRPGIAGAGLGLGFGQALGQDLGLFDSGTAEAQTLTDRQRQRLEIERQRREGTAKTDAERREQESTIRARDAEAAARLELDKAAKAKNRQEYDRAIARAEDIMAVERGRQKTFKDTAVGGFWDEYGSVMPAAIGGAAGFANRALHPTAPWWAPIASGAGAGALSTNLPLGADAYITPPALNPDRRAYERGAEELMLVPGAEERRQAYTDYAQTLPEANPQRTEAQKHLFDPGEAAKRLAFGAGEGAFGGEIGSALWGVPARLRGLFGGGAAAPMTPAPPPPPPWQNLPRDAQGRWRPRGNP